MKLPGLLTSGLKFAGSTTGRLAASYLVVIMVMSFGYSLVLYQTSASQLQRQLPPSSLFDSEFDSDLNSELDVDIRNDTSGRQSRGELGPSRQVNEFFENRIAEGRRVLVTRLILLNLVTLLAAAVLSYYLARRTLKPIEDSLEAQSQFVGDASHELRTPLTTIQTSNEVALRNPKLNLPQSKKLLEQNIEEVAKLQALTDGLLKLARSDETMALTEESLQDIATDAMNRLIRVAQARDIVIDDQVSDAKVLSHRQSLSQAVVVLLDNAIKYSPPGSTVLLTGGKRGRQAILQVRDKGPGIRPYDLRRIFDRFYRADQSRSGQHIPGNGIGLSLAKKLVEQQGGEIRVTSTVGKGSIFTITMPLA